MLKYERYRYNFIIYLSNKKIIKFPFIIIKYNNKYSKNLLLLLFRILKSSQSNFLVVAEIKKLCYHIVV